MIICRGSIVLNDILFLAVVVLKTFAAYGAAMIGADNMTLGRQRPIKGLRLRLAAAGASTATSDELGRELFVLPLG